MSRVAIVTGGSSGMGAATVTRLQAQGVEVAVFDVQGDHPVDVADRAAVEAAVAEVRERSGPVDIVGADLTDGGFTDWYLPAREELYMLWNHRAAINANAAGAFTTSIYWASTEENTTTGQDLDFNTGFFSNHSKNTNQDVRCVRRD